MQMRSWLTALVLLASPGLAFAAGMVMGSDADKALMDVNDKMTAAMKTEPTGDADKDFVAMMIPHHQGAVDMAEVELKYGKDPAILKLARTIVSSQEKEIAQMKAWQTRHP